MRARRELNPRPTDFFIPTRDLRVRRSNLTELRAHAYAWKSVFILEFRAFGFTSVLRLVALKY